MLANEGMPFSGRPFFTYGTRCSPWSSPRTSSDVIRLGPVAPLAWGPWQNAQFCLKTGAPRAAATLSGFAPRPRNSRVAAARCSGVMFW